MLAEKICRTCHVNKTLLEYNKDLSSKDGYKHHCRECLNKKKRKSYISVSEKKNSLNELNREFRLKIKKLTELLSNCDIHDFDAIYKYIGEVKEEYKEKVFTLTMKNRITLTKPFDDDDLLKSTIQCWFIQKKVILSSDEMIIGSNQGFKTIDLPDNCKISTEENKSLVEKIYSLIETKSDS